MFCNLFRLVELALPLTFPEQGNRNQYTVLPVRGKPGVLQCKFCETPEFVGQVDFMQVFKIMDKLAGSVFTVESGSGKLEVERHLRAVRADKLTADLAVVALPAGVAKGRLDQGEVVIASLAKRVSMAEWYFAEFTVSGVDEVEQS